MLTREQLNADVTYAFDTLDELFWLARIRLSTRQDQNGDPPTTTTPPATARTSATADDSPTPAHAESSRRCTGGPGTEPFDPATLDDGAVDEFARAYLAETTRWREEHIYDLLAIKSGPRDAC
ncbi:hypothetical protein [Actinocorallia libanotica]|uniref:Uncharacterized protein n=1 Tax=Actinocorallia libanotica TaxID=46162 RepID=A0ABN1RJF1_9ACTN